MKNAFPVSAFGENLYGSVPAVHGKEVNLGYSTTKNAEKAKHLL
jgi:hypothetical protein